jgi:hypothetical protein
MTHRKIPDEFFCIAFVWYFRFEKSHSLRFLQRLESTSPAASGIYDYYSVINFHQVGLSLATHLL